MLQKEMPSGQFDAVIRMLKKTGMDRVTAVRTATFKTLKRLKVKRDMPKAVKGIPEGTDDHNIMSIVVWLDRVAKEDKKAIKQIVKMDATAVARGKG